jgi:hypothetical protein
MVRIATKYRLLKKFFAVFASEAKQSRILTKQGVIDCHVAKIAPRNDVTGVFQQPEWT